MKEKIKEFLLHFLIIYVVFIVIGSLIQLINYPTEIELHDSNENKLKYVELKKEADLVLEDNNCHNAIREVVNYYERTSFDGKVNIRKFAFDEDNGQARLALNLTENCSQYKSKLDEENIVGKILANMMIYEEIFYSSNSFEYEIFIGDVYNRSLFESSLTNAEYDAERRLQLEIIKELLEIVKEDKVNEE